VAEAAPRFSSSTTVKYSSRIEWAGRRYATLIAMDGLATKALDDLAEGDLQALMNAEPEGKLIEYKEQLALGKDSERKEFLADVSSFANAAGECPVDRRK
jgi:hypothetical protein